MTNKVKFAELMQFLAIGIKGQELTKIELQAYWYALEDEFNNIEEFEKAVKKLLKSWKYSYFPKPSHFLEANKIYTEPEMEKIALDAWKTALNAIESGVGYNKIGEFEDRLIPAVIERCEGFKELSKAKYEELKWIKKDFINFYKMALNNEMTLKIENENIAELQEVKKIYFKAPYKTETQNKMVLEHKEKQEDAVKFIGKIKKF